MKTKTNKIKNEENLPRQSYVMYRGFINSIERIKDEKFKYQAYKMIANYALDGIEPDTNLNEILLVLFDSIKPQIDNNLKRFENCVNNGKKGGNPAFKKGKPNKYYKSKDNQKDNQRHNQRHNLNENENENENENVNENEREQQSCGFLSQKEIALFSNAFPNKKICTNVPNNINLELLIEKINESDWLSKNNNLDLEWCLEKYKEITNGNYKDYNKSNNKTITGKENSSGELNYLFEKVEDIDF